MELHEVLFSVGGQGVAEIVRRRRQRRHANRARERSVFLFQVLTRPARGFVYYIKDRGYRVSQRPPSPELVRSPEPRDRCVVRVPDVRVGRLRSWARSRRGGPVVLAVAARECPSASGSCACGRPCVATRTA